MIANGAAFGSEMEKVMRLIEDYPNITLYLPKSFEWLILKSGVVMNGSIEEILENPGDYIESRDYFSWERYFTSLLIQSTQDSYLKYAKRELNLIYLREKILDKILGVMKGIRFGFSSGRSQ